MNTIEITFKDGHKHVWERNEGEWDNYEYDGKVFIICKKNEWVGFYNIDCVMSIVVK